VRFYWHRIQIRAAVVITQINAFIASLTTCISKYYLNEDSNNTSQIFIEKALKNKEVLFD